MRLFSAPKKFSIYLSFASQISRNITVEFRHPCFIHWWPKCRIFVPGPWCLPWRFLCFSSFSQNECWDCWIKIDQLDVTCLLLHYLLLSMFRMLVHPSSGACDLLWIYFMCCIAPNSICEGNYRGLSMWLSTQQIDYWSYILHSPSTWEKMGVQWRSSSALNRLQESLWFS